VTFVVIGADIVDVAAATLEAAAGGRGPVGRRAGAPELGGALHQVVVVGQHELLLGGEGTGGEAECETGQGASHHGRMGPALRGRRFRRER
jgi:hypothetical protein